MKHLSTETRARSAARDLARRFDVKAGVWRCNDTEYEYAVGALYEGLSLPGGPERWELRFIASPKERARDLVGAMLVLAVFMAAAVLA